MENRTLYAVIAAVLLGIGAFFAVRAPEKGERKAGERPVAVIKGDDIVKLEIVSQTGDATTIERKGDGWRITAPADYPADANAVKTLVDAIGKLTFGDIVGENPAKFTELGVGDKGSTHLKITTKSSVADLLLGQTLSGFQMIRVAGKNQVWQGSNLFTYQVNKPTKDWRDHSVLTFAIGDVDKLNVDSPTAKLALTRNADKKSWTVVEATGDAPKAGDPLDNSQPATVAQAMGSMRADDFADGKSAKDAGLEPPTMTVTAGVGAKSYALEVGALDGDAYYVRVKDAPTIYKVKKYSLDRVAYRPIDYRDKTLLAVKAADVNKIEITQGKDKTVLVKAGDKWALSPTAPLDDGKAKALVGGVDSLQGSSVLTDKTVKTELDKPRATVTVTPAKGSPVTLKVGGLTKDSAEYYVTADGRKDVLLAKKFAVDRLLKKPAELVPSPKPPARPPGGGMPPGMQMPPGMRPPH